MIAALRGTLLAVGADYAVIEAGGVGYQVWAPRGVLQSLPEVGDEARLHTYLLVREDALLLYGFATQAERSFFELLLTVTGVGPRVALSLMSSVPLDQLQVAIASENATLLAQVPGIGKKTAARLILELKSKMNLDALPALASATGAAAHTNTEVQEILQSLGYSAAEAQAAVASLPADAPVELEERLRLALRYFGGA
ncbi:MAG: Holliday junction branch migration protein RuvA [Chloroflexota bacterium]|nr:Holliday junction branch migration protein RuvA [Chloroflexota bacterium]